MKGIEVILGMGVLGLVAFGGYDIIHAITGLPNAMEKKVKGEIPSLSFLEDKRRKSQNNGSVGVKAPDNTYSSDYVSYYKNKVAGDMANEKKVNNTPLSYYLKRQANVGGARRTYTWRPSDPQGTRGSDGQWITGAEHNQEELEAMPWNEKHTEDWYR